MSRKVLINICLSIIRPVLEYADIVWDNCILHESNLLEIVQVEAGRIITGLKINSSKAKLYEELGSLYIKDVRNINLFSCIKL